MLATFIGGSQMHTQEEDVPWEINIPDHPDRSDSAAFVAAKTLARKIMGTLQGGPYGPGPWQMHHGGSLWTFDGQGWFLAFHVYTRFVKVTFFRGTALRPVPPGASKQTDVRYLDVHEDGLDETQLASWVKQAAALPGWMQ